MMCLSDLAVISQKEMLCVRSLMTLSWDKAVSHCLTNQISLAKSIKVPLFRPDEPFKTTNETLAFLISPVSKENIPVPFDD